MDTTENVIYLAGGCFWGMEQLMQSIPGVIDAQSGYANGSCEADATYQTVCKGDTGFRVAAMRPVFNRRALFTDTSAEYVIPEEPACFSEVTIRFRAARINMDRVFLVCGGQ